MLFRSGSDWEYVFWVDLDVGEGEPALAAALEGLRGVTMELRLLGSYLRATEPVPRG